MLPSRPSSPSHSFPSSDFFRQSSSATSSASAIGRSNAAPSLRTSAGARFIVTDAAAAQTRVFPAANPDSPFDGTGRRARPSCIGAAKTVDFDVDKDRPRYRETPADSVLGTARGAAAAIMPSALAFFRREQRNAKPPVSVYRTLSDFGAVCAYEKRWIAGSAKLRIFVVASDGKCAIGQHALAGQDDIRSFPDGDAQRQFRYGHFDGRFITSPSKLASSLMRTGVGAVTLSGPLSDDRSSANSKVRSHRPGGSTRQTADHRQAAPANIRNAGTS